MDDTFRRCLETSADEFLSVVEKRHSRSDKCALKSFIWSLDASRISAAFWDALSLRISAALSAFENPSSSLNDDVAKISHLTPPKKKRTRSTAAKNPNDQRQPPSEDVARLSLLEKIKAYAYLAQCFITNPRRAFKPTDLFPTVKALHEKLVLFENEAALQDCISSICEHWWRDSLPGKESLIAQTLPYLVSRSICVGKKVHIHRVYAMKEAFTYLDFTDSSIEDLKHLLIRCLVTPSYLRIDEGKRFLSFLFGLNSDLVNELIAIIRSQIPFGRNSILEAYGEIVYKAWRVCKGSSLDEIENNCIQGLMEGAILSSSRMLASNIRKVLAAFINQRTQEGVESFLYRLQEPILFRFLQAANSNVRRNALLLFVDLFPLENPDASKEEKESLLEKQFLLLDKLLADDCPDVRSVAVEGSCRILRLFWEIVPGHIAAKLIQKIIAEMAKDVSSSTVRCAVVNGIIYLLENPQSHGMLKLVLPNIGHLFVDSSPSVRIAVADLLLTLKDIPELQFDKVVELDSILLALETDQLAIAERLTRLLIPTYFPSKVPISEALTRFLSLVKRTPNGAARFCECALLAGVSHKSLLELLRFLIALPMASAGIDSKEREGIVLSVAQLCSILESNQSCKTALKEIFTVERFNSLMGFASSRSAYTALLQIGSIFPAKDILELVKHCEEVIMDFGTVIQNRSNQEEVRAAYNLVNSLGGFDDFAKALAKILANCNSDSDKENTQKRGSIHTASRRNKRSPQIHLKWKIRKGALYRKSGKGSSDESYANAVVASWHIENLLADESTREALLSSSCLEFIVSGLKSVAKTIFLQHKQLSISFLLLPVQAYLSLTIHLTAQNCHFPNTKNASHKDDTDPLISLNGMDDTLKEVLTWAESYFSAVQVRKRDESLSATRKSKRKCSQDKVCNLQRDSLATNSSVLYDDNIQIIDKNKAFGAAITTASLLKKITDAGSLKLLVSVEVHARCLEFALACLQYIKLEIKSLTDAETYLGEEWKQILTFVRSSMSYCAKLVHLCLKRSDDLGPQVFKLANNIIDLIILVQAAVGSKCALSIVGVLKQWIIDILIALSTIDNSLYCNENINYVRSRKNFDELAEEGKLSHYDWFEALGNAEASMFNLQDAPERHPDEDENNGPENKIETNSQDKLICAFQEFIKTLTTQLQKGDPILQAFTKLLLSQVAYMLKQKNHRKALGLLHFTCTKVLRYSETDQAHGIHLSDGILHCFEEIDTYLEKVSEAIQADQTEVQMVQVARKPVNTVLSSHKNEVPVSCL